MTLTTHHLVPRSWLSNSYTATTGVLWDCFTFHYFVKFVFDLSQWLDRHYKFNQRAQAIPVCQREEMGHSSLMMEAVRTSETSVDNYFTRQYIPEDNSELHTRRHENLKSHTVLIRTSERFAIKVCWKGWEVGKVIQRSAYWALPPRSAAKNVGAATGHLTWEIGPLRTIYVHTTPNKKTHPRSEKDGLTQRAP
jgi:hypothetical protein